MTSIHNDYIGHPDEGTPEEQAAQRKTLIAIAEYLERQKNKPKLVSYIKTHGPWNERLRVCLSCGRTEIAIHADMLRCDEGA